MQSVIRASEEQIYQLLNKHLKFIKNFLYSYDSEDEIGFVKLETKTGKIIQYQLTNGTYGDTPSSVSFSGFGNIRYDITYPKNEMYEILKNYGIKAKENFWRGSQI